MSDVNLLIFGCAVTFIALAGGYVSVRERLEARSGEVRQRKARLRQAA